MGSFDSDDDYVSFDLDETDDSDVDDDYDDEDLEDASEEDIDLTIAAYREDGAVVVTALPNKTANDLEDLISQLLRLPGDAGAIGFVSLVDDVFIAVRVRGRKVQVVLSDAFAAEEWPLARDVLDYLNLDLDSFDDDDDIAPAGDLEIFADLGVSEMDLELLIDNLDDSSDMVVQVADRIGMGRQVRAVVDTEF